ERGQKGDERRLVGVGEREPQRPPAMAQLAVERRPDLNAAVVKLDYLAQGREPAVMHVGSAPRDVLERWGLEDPRLARVETVARRLREERAGRLTDARA